MALKAPCQDCGDRELKCHATCKKYKDYKVSMATVKANRVAYSESITLHKPMSNKKSMWKTHKY